MRLVVNGAEMTFQKAITVTEFFAQQGLGKQGTALFINGKVVAPADYPTTVIEDGDNLEIVRLVGGG